MPEPWRNPFRGTKNIPVRQFPGKQESSLSININETVLFQHITGIEIKETWQEKNGEWFAVAVLNKKRPVTIILPLQKNRDKKYRL